MAPQRTGFNINESHILHHLKIHTNFPLETFSFAPNIQEIIYWRLPSIFYALHYKSTTMASLFIEDPLADNRSGCWTRIIQYRLFTPFAEPQMEMKYCMHSEDFVSYTLTQASSSPFLWNVLIVQPGCKPKHINYHSFSLGKSY